MEPAIFIVASCVGIALVIVFAVVLIGNYMIIKKPKGRNPPEQTFVKMWAGKVKIKISRPGADTE